MILFWNLCFVFCPEFTRALVEDLSNRRSPEILIDRFRNYCANAKANWFENLFFSFYNFLSNQTSASDFFIIVILYLFIYLKFCLINLFFSELSEDYIIATRQYFKF